MREGGGGPRCPPGPTRRPRDPDPPGRGREHGDLVVPTVRPRGRAEGLRREPRPRRTLRPDPRGRRRRRLAIGIDPAGARAFGVSRRRRLARVLGGAVKLLCDHMLGSLARWLRFMGYDTAYPEPGPDRTLIERARAEDRILLTRDKELATRVPGSVAVRSDVLEEQIREVAARLALQRTPGAGPRRRGGWTRAGRRALPPPRILEVSLLSPRLLARQSLGQDGG